jgi:gliding motility-associated-like protein
MVQLVQPVKHVVLVISLFLFISEWVTGQVLLHPNRGQWDERIAYKIDLDIGELLIEPQGLTHNLFHFEIPHQHDGHSHDDRFIQHVVKTKLVGSQLPTHITEGKVLSYYRNYFLGKDSTKWKSHVNSVQEVTFHEVYSGIDIYYEGLSSSLKYSFHVAPQVHPSVIAIQIEGSNGIKIDKKGNLVISTNLGDIIEHAPSAWTINSSGEKTKVDCAFRLKNNILSFQLGNYNNADLLVIDPELTFSTFTGATSDNWGFTACPDNQGNLFAGGIVFGTGYPVTTGAFDTSFNGGHVTTGAGGGTIPGFDVSITKFNSTGTQNLYSTFLGGNGNETPNSIVTNAAGELFILGITSSPNFPVSAGAFQPGFNGGPTTTQYLVFQGSDLFITRLSANGANLLGSTYIGGTDNDGLNYGSNLLYNYGDAFRGEIVVDGNSNVYFSSTTRSANFPGATTSGSLSGQQDAVYGRLNPTLTTLDFCRYFGGTGYESGNSIQLSPANELYITGGTTSAALSLGSGGLYNSTRGATDAYVIRANSANGAILNGTFLGTTAYDQGYFVQIDLDNQVYVMGQTAGNYAFSGVYGQPNSGQFIHKLSENLTNSIWSTTLGSGFGTVQISPTAFLVSDCYDIYLSGWGGQTNAGNSLATNSSSNGFPVTSDAFQSVTNGSNFYIAVLDKDAAYLKYGTYMGGMSSSANHVDGGTSRFDKNGTIYHAVCGSCGASTTGFTTTPGVWSPTAQSNNCNLAAFKFDLSVMSATIGNTEPFICLPNPVIFQNSSSNGNAFFWDFGDGNTSTAINPSHTYAGPGDYTITLVVLDTNNCYLSDTAYFDISIAQYQGNVQSISDPVCPGATVQLNASGGTSYLWSPANLLNNSQIANPVATVQETTLFQVIVSDSCGTDTLQVLVEVFEAVLEIQAQQLLCRGDTIDVAVNLNGLINIQWTPEEFFTNPTGVPTQFFPFNSSTILLTAETSDGCLVQGSLFIEVDTAVPVLELPDTLRLCRNSSISVTASGATTYEWYPNQTISNTLGATVSVSPTESMTYYVIGTNSCGSALDSVHIEVIEVYPSAGNDTIICPGQIAFVWASGGVSYSWTPANFVVSTQGSTAIVSPTVPTNFIVWVTDENGCTDTASVFVDLFPLPFVQTTPDYYGFPGDPITIGATGTGPGTYSWSPGEYLSCVNCQSTSVSATQTITYTVTFEDENGCTAQDQVTIHFDPIIYVPNTFTPDGNNFNGIFKAEGGNIKTFHLKIFNRWGELVFESYRMDTGWDGTYGGMNCPDATYIWVIEYTGEDDIPHKIVGHVNLLR